MPRISRYRSRYSTNVDMERELKEFADHFGIRLSLALHGGLKYLIQERIEREEVSFPLKEAWLKFLEAESEQYREEITRDVEHLHRASESGKQKKLKDCDDARLIKVWNDADGKYETIPAGQFNPDFHRRVQ